MIATSVWIVRMALSTIVPARRTTQRVTASAAHSRASGNPGQQALEFAALGPRFRGDERRYGATGIVSDIRADILIFGTGNFAGRIALDLAATASEPVTVALAGRNRERLDWLRTA